MKPNRHVIIGDFMDCASVSTHKKHTLDELTLGEEYAVANKDLDDLERVLPDDCELIYLLGNHEDRINAYVYNQAPNLAGAILDVEGGLRLKERGWKCVPYNKHIRVGRLILAHGCYTNQYSAAKHVNSFGDSIMVGHTHGHQAHVVAHGNSPHIGMTIGCLCKLDQGYTKGRPLPWIHGFGVVYHVGRDFVPYFVPIINKKAVFNGKLYGSGSSSDEPLELPEYDAEVRG